MASPIECEVDWINSSLENGEDKEIHFDALEHPISMDTRMQHVISNSLDVVLYLFLMSSTIYEDLFYASVGKEFQGIFD